jgi:hypothetical protein
MPVMGGSSGDLAPNLSRTRAEGGHLANPGILGNLNNLLFFGVLGNPGVPTRHEEKSPNRQDFPHRAQRRRARRDSDRRRPSPQDHVRVHPRASARVAEDERRDRGPDGGGQNRHSSVDSCGGLARTTPGTFGRSSAIPLPAHNRPVDAFLLDAFAGAPPPFEAQASAALESIASTRRAAS